MNKTIIININGIVFHIEEDAYEILKNYMTDIKRHFSTSADSLEITTDIENRIAEMFNEALTRDNKPVIVEADVNRIIEQMGSVADFEDAENDVKTGTSNTFTYNTERRRLFRDPDDHLLGGICAGIANYFDIKAIWIRLVFVILTAFFATGLIVYIILWIIIPKAVSRADRMAMKGEKQDLRGFKKNFEDELGTIRQNLSSAYDESRPIIYKARDFVGDFVDHLGNFLKGAGRLFVKFVAAAIALGSLGLAITLIVAFVAFFATGNIDIYKIFPFNVVNHQANMMFLAGGFFLLAVPLFAIMLGAISFLFKSVSFNRSIGVTLLCIWIASLATVVYYGVKTAADFREGGMFTQSVSIKPTANNTYYLQLNNTKYLSKEDSVNLKIQDRFKGVVIMDDNFNGKDLQSPDNNVSIDIEKSDVPQPVLLETFKARGRNLQDALLNARNVTYRFTQADTILNFDRYLEMAPDFMWRGQELHITLKLPLNAKVIVDQRLDRNIWNLDLYKCKTDNGSDDKATTAKFTMTQDGLQCVVDTAHKVKAENKNPDYEDN